MDHLPSTLRVWISQAESKSADQLVDLVVHYLVAENICTGSYLTDILVQKLPQNE